MAERDRPHGRPRRGPLGALTSFLAIAILAISLFIAVIAYVGIGRVYEIVVADLPDPRALESIVLSENSTVWDRSNTVELATFGSDRRDNLSFSEIPPLILDTTTAIEDKTYWTNAGFDVLAFASATIDTLRGQGRGGSTITQQLTRGLLLPPSAFQGSVFERKAKEIIQSIRLTTALPGREGKERIITAYLNNNYYGSRAYGIRAAAASYFGVTDLSTLTLGQAALLAGLPQSPSTYDLRTNALRADDGRLLVPLESRIAQRRLQVLDLLRLARDAGLTISSTYTDQEIEAARSEPIVLTEQSETPMLAPHFVNRVETAAREILCPELPACPAIDGGGYRIITTLDWSMQQAAERWAAVVRLADAQDPVAYLKSIGVKPSDWPSRIRGGKVHNAAIETMDARTGEILAYVGSANYYDTRASAKFQPQYDVLSGWRQPGSAIKPLTYGYAIESRAVTASTLFMDAPTDFGQGWTPGGWDNNERGPVRLRHALQGSLNIPAVKAAIRAGADSIWDSLNDGAFSFRADYNEAGAALALGAIELRYTDLLAGYGALANGGALVEQHLIKRIEDRSGVLIWEAAPTTRQVISPETAGLITDIIAGNTTPAINPLWASRKLTAADGRRRPATLKTGTSDSARDLAAFGYLAPPSDPSAPQLVTGVWLGNSDATFASGTSMATSGAIWQAYFNEISRDLPVQSFTIPATLEPVLIDAVTGELPGPCTSRTITEYYLPDTAPTTSCSIWVTLPIDTVTGERWIEGCSGSPTLLTLLDLSLLESSYPNWQAGNIEWIERALQGPGTRGGLNNGRTSYFYASYWRPNGASWGGPLAPLRSCTPSVPPSVEPSPSVEPTPTPTPTPTVTPTPTPAPPAP